MASQWVSDIKEFTPNSPSIIPYIAISGILGVIASTIATKCCVPSGDGITVTDAKTGETSQNKWVPWILFFSCIIIIPLIITQSLYKLHFMVLNPKFTGTVVGTSMIRNALR